MELEEDIPQPLISSSLSPTEELQSEDDINSDCSETSGPPPPEEHTCQLCGERYKQPRVLCCLHVFCTPCLVKAVEKEKEGEDGELVASLIPNIAPTLLSCTICKQLTRLSDKGVDDLPIDHVLVNMMDMSAIEEMQIICTSCKAKEKAVARCSDCANFLCANCVTAHQYMRCFENHKVVSFDELKDTDGGSLHKPLFCESHPTETMKNFCHTCQVPICNECLVTEHKQPEHKHERITDIHETQAEELRVLVKEAQGKISYCEEATSQLSNTLTDLQMERDDARSLIQETFHTYKAILETRMDEVLSELDDMHSKHELSIMDLLHSVEKTLERIEDGCSFSNRLLQKANGTELLLQKRVVTTQLLSLINNTPKDDTNINIKFVSDKDKFTDAVKKYFGSFQLHEKDFDDSKSETASGPEDHMGLHTSLESEGIHLPTALLGNSEMLPKLSHLSTLPPLSMPPLNTVTNLPAPTVTPEVPSRMTPTLPANLAGVSAQTINSIATSIQNLGAERSSSRNSYSPAMSDSGISVDAASSNSSGTNQPIIDMGALSRLGAVSVNNSGQITLNGQIVPGLNIDNVSNNTHQPIGATTPVTPVNPPTPTLDTALPGLLNSAIPRVPTPQLTELSNLLGQTGTAAISNLASSLAATDLASTTPVVSPVAGSTTPGTRTPISFQAHFHSPFMRAGEKKMSAMQIRCKFGQLGPGKGQFNSPHGFCLGMEEDIIVADTNNHRIQVFEKTGEFKYQFGIPGREEGQLWYPRKVAVIRHSGKYVVCDRGNERSRMQIFTKTGHFIKKIAIRYIDIVAGLAITHQGHIVAVDSVSPTVFCIAETGDLVKWFDCSDYMREPSDIAISGREYFVCDFKGHCVVVFNEDGQFMRRIGCENITNYPNGIDISDAGDVLVGDSHGNRFHVAVFQREGSLIGEFECPYVKVSRCCGLKITSEGYVVTLAKNNHHVLVLNTLYIA